MKIINRYVLKEHIGPFVFALSALTSLLLLQYIARRFGDLVGKGLSWQVITEFFLLSIPFTVAMTLPMAVLVAVLYAFSRLASENEITALKAGGVSSRALMKPAIVASVFLAIGMLWFNDQILSRANHELATLQIAILRTKPSFALKEQVINTVKEGQLYLRAGYIDRDQSGRMRDITIYDVSDAGRRRTIYADSGTLAFAPNKRDLVMHLFKGMMLSSPTAQTDQLDRIYYSQDALKVRDVANSFQSVDADTASKGEREMNVCEMQTEYEAAMSGLTRARYDSTMAAWHVAEGRGHHTPQPPAPVITKAGGIGALYCAFITKYLHVPAAQAEELPPHLRFQDTTGRKQDTTHRQDTTKHRDSTKHQDSTKLLDTAKQKDTAKAGTPGAAPVTLTPAQPPGAPGSPATAGVPATPGATYPGQVPAVKPPGTPGAVPPAGGQAAAMSNLQPAVTPARPGMPVPGQAAVTPGASVRPVPFAAGANAIGTIGTPEMIDAKIRIDDARHRRNRYGVEIQKKFSLAAACIVFVLVGAPIALRFPRGGVGLVIGVSFAVFAIYYVGLIGGESLANNNIITPFWAMWADNVIFVIVGLILLSRMGHEGVTSRGGSMGEFMDATRMWFARQTRRVGTRRQAAEQSHA